MKINVEPNGTVAMFYSSTPAENRCVGHVRIDFGRDGTEFWHTWWPHEACDRLKNARFTADLDDVIYELRKNLLKSLKGMRKFITDNKGARLDDGVYGYHVETEQFEFFIRCIPYLGDYNAYVYCYAKEE